ncbi:MAG: hypothetical protein EOP48_19520 [Sphingobacteriales bacterium]|nr:MAG: hypothetical protein EOP48_19520 [Sphingobacteriales bacterium]
MEKIILLIAFLTIDFHLQAQPGIGCFRSSDGLLYSQKNVFGYYELLGNKYPTSPPACPRVQLGTTTGSKCQFVALGTLHDEYNYILYTETGPIKCNIDHYALGAIAAVGLFALFKLKKG